MKQKHMKNVIFAKGFQATGDFKTGSLLNNQYQIDVTF